MEIKDYIPQNLIDYSYKIAGIRNAEKFYCVPDQVIRVQKLSAAEYADPSHKVIILAYETVRNWGNYFDYFFELPFKEDLGAMDPSILAITRAAIGKHLFTGEAMSNIDESFDWDNIPHELYISLWMEDGEFERYIKNTNWETLPTMKYLVESGVFDMLSAFREGPKVRNDSLFSTDE